MGCFLNLQVSASCCWFVLLFNKLIVCCCDGSTRSMLQTNDVCPTPTKPTKQSIVIELDHVDQAHHRCERCGRSTPRPPPNTKTTTTTTTTKQHNQTQHATGSTINRNRETNRYINARYPPPHTTTTQPKRHTRKRNQRPHYRKHWTTTTTTTNRQQPAPQQ